MPLVGLPFERKGAQKKTTPPGPNKQPRRCSDSAEPFCAGRVQPSIRFGTNMDRGWKNVTSSSTRIIMA